MDESEPHRQITCSSYLRVTNGDFVMLAFTSVEEMFFFFCTEAVTLNLPLLALRQEEGTKEYFIQFMKVQGKHRLHRAPEYKEVNNLV